MTTNLRRYPYRVNADGVQEKYCTGCDKFLPVTEYYVRRSQGKRGNGKYVSRCKQCVCRKQTSHGDVGGWVPMVKVWFIFEELARRVGQTRSAEEVGMTPDAFRNIRYRRTKNVQKRHVVRAITYLRCLRLEGVWDPPKEGAPLGFGEKQCVRCGCDLDQYTPGCKSCTDRRAARVKRGLIKLTRAQMFGMFSVASKAPVDARFEVTPPDNMGVVIITVVSDDQNINQKYKVPANGGPELIS